MAFGTTTAARGLSAVGRMARTLSPQQRKPTFQDFSVGQFADGSTAAPSALEPHVAGPALATPNDLSPASTAVKIAHAFSSAIANRDIDAANHRRVDQMMADAAAKAKQESDYRALQARALTPEGIQEHARATALGTAAANDITDPQIQVPGALRTANPSLPATAHTGQVKAWTDLFTPKFEDQSRVLGSAEMADYARIMSPDQHQRATTTGLTGREIAELESRAKTHREVNAPYAGAGKSDATDAANEWAGETVRGLINHTILPSEVERMRGPTYAATLAEARRQGFDLNKAHFQEQNAAAFDHTSNGQFFVRQRMAVPTVAAHLQQYQDLYDQLAEKAKVNNVRVANQSLYWLAKHVGDSNQQAAYASLASNRDILAPELAVLLSTSSQVTDASRKDMKEVLDTLYGKKAQAASVSTVKNMIRARAQQMIAALPAAGGRDNPYLLQRTPLYLWDETIGAPGATAPGAHPLDALVSP